MYIIDFLIRDVSFFFKHNSLFFFLFGRYDNYE